MWKKTQQAEWEKGKEEEKKDRTFSFIFTDDRNCNTLIYFSCVLYPSEGRQMSLTHCCVGYKWWETTS